MRDWEIPSRSQKNEREPFDIEHLNIKDLDELDQDFDKDLDELNQLDEEDPYPEELSLSSKMSSHKHYASHASHKKNILSILSKRTLLVSLVVLLGFIAIFMWSWIFEVLGFFSGNTVSTLNKQETQKIEIISLPNDITKEEDPRRLSGAENKDISTVDATKPLERTDQNQDQNHDLAAQQKLVEEQLKQETVVLQSPLESTNLANKKEIEKPTTRTKAPALNLKQETLLLNRKPTNFTIQILGMQDENKLQAFIAKSSLKSKLTFYKTKREGKPWYVLVYGDFETKQKAENAITTLPEEIQKNKPWVRSLQDVQEAIRGNS